MCIFLLKYLYKILILLQNSVIIINVLSTRLIRVLTKKEKGFKYGKRNERVPGGNKTIIRFKEINIRLIPECLSTFYHHKQ